MLQQNSFKMNEYFHGDDAMVPSRTERTEGDMKNESLCSIVHRWFPVPPVPVLRFVLTQIIDY